MSATVIAEDQVSVKSEDSVTGRAKFLCSYGGKIMPRPQDSLLRYVGGETRILSVPRAVTFMDLMSKLRRLCQYDNIILKYQLPSEDLDALVSVFSDEDLENMMEEYDRIESKDSSSRLRLFLFPAASPRSSAAADPEQKFFEALNGVYGKAAFVPETSPVEEQRKPVVLIQPAPAVMDKLPLSGVPLQLSTSPLVAAPVRHPVAQAPSVVPQVVQHLVTPAPVMPPVFHSPVPANPSVLPTQNLMAVPPSLAAPKVVAVAAPSPAIRVATPGTVIPQMVAARTCLPQVTPASKPSAYVPLVDVSRGILPKGMVLRQVSVEDDHHSDSRSSQNSQMNDIMLDRRDSGELLRDEDRYVRDFRTVQDNVILQHVPDRKVKRPDLTGLVLGGAKVPAADTHLERYLVEQTGGDAGLALAHPHVGVQLYVPGGVTSVPTDVRDPYAMPRAASSPALEPVDVPVTAGTTVHQQFHRQLSSDRSEPHLHHQENVIPNVRACIALDGVVQLDERFPTPVLHQLNGLRPQQQAQPQQQQVVISDQQVQKPIKMVPQVVAMNPFKVP